MGFGASAALAAPQITNGDFEASNASGAFDEIPNGTGGVQGWQVGHNGVDLIGTLWEPAAGDQSLDLSMRTAGSISQTVSGFTVGSIYTLSFALAGNPQGGESLKEVRVDLDGGDPAGAASSVFSFSTTSSSTTDMGWVTQAFSFEAAATDVTLTFKSLNESPYGPALDNVRLASGRGRLADVPVPATFGLLAGSLIAVGWYRRRIIARGWGVVA